MLIDTLKEKGVIATKDGDRLVIETDDPLTDEQRAFIRQNKPQIMEEILISTANSRNSTLHTETRRIPESVEAEWERAIHPQDLESQGRQKIAWVTTYCPELGIPTDELEEWYKDDMRDIATLSLEHVYRIIRDYVDLRRYYRRGMQ